MATAAPITQSASAPTGWGIDASGHFAPITPPATSAPVKSSTISNGSSLNYPPAPPVNNGNSLAAAANASVASTIPKPAPTSSTPALDAAAIPTGYEKINGAQYSTAAAQKAAYSNIQQIGTGAGSYLIGKPIGKTVQASSTDQGGAQTGTGTGTGTNNGDLTSGDITQDPNVSAAQSGLTTANTNYANEIANEKSQGTFLQTEEANRNVPALNQAVVDAQNEYNTAQAAYNAKYAQIEASGRANGVASVDYMGQEGALQRVAAADLAAKAIAVQTAQGNYTAAENLAVQAANNLYADQQNQIDAAKQFIQMNQNNLTQAEQLATQKMQVQLQDKQNALNDLKSAAQLRLQYPNAGITSTDSLALATDKASQWLAANPASQGKLINLGTTNTDTGTQTNYGYQMPDGSVRTITPDSTTPSSNLGPSSGTDLGQNVFNTAANNPPGTPIPVADRNPTNITATADSVKLPGVVGVDKRSNGYTYLVFSSPAAGLAASQQMITNPSGTYAKKNAAVALATFKGLKNSDGTLNVNAGAVFARQFGLDPNKDFQSQLTPDILPTFMNQLAVSEGFRGNMSDSTVTIAAQDTTKAGSPTENKPNYSPTTGIGATSPQKQWVFTHDGWVPNGTAAVPQGYAQYGLLSNTNFDPTSASDKYAQTYLQYYLKNGELPNFRTIFGYSKTGNLSTVANRANDLFYQATGSSLPDVQILKSNKAIIASNNKMANNLRIQESTVQQNVDLSLANLKSNNLNSTGIKPLNDFLNTIGITLQDPNVAQLVSQNVTIQNELGSLLAVKNATGTTVYDKLASAGIISSGDSPDVVTKKVNTLLTEAKNFADSLDSANADLWKEVDPLEQSTKNPNRQARLSPPVAPTTAPPAGQMWVKDNTTGQIGSVPKNEFDPSQYTAL